jgi:hypothetical protein
VRDASQTRLEPQVTFSFLFFLLKLMVITGNLRVQHTETGMETEMEMRTRALELETLGMVFSPHFLFFN